MSSNKLQILSQMGNCENILSTICPKIDFTHLSVLFYQKRYTYAAFYNSRSKLTFPRNWTFARWFICLYVWSEFEWPLACCYFYYKRFAWLKVYLGVYFFFYNTVDFIIVLPRRKIIYLLKKCLFNQNSHLATSYFEQQNFYWSLGQIRPAKT